MTKPVTTEYVGDSHSESVLWCGSEASFNAYLEGRASIRAAMIAGTLKAFTSDEDEASYNAGSHLLTKSGNIGIITVAGALTNEDSPYNRYFGMTSYPEIGRALQAAVADPSIKQIAMNYATGGGQVNGVHDTATAIAQVNKTMKPVSSYTGSAMASAGLWLGASGRTIAVSPTAVIGSIGILNVHTETSKMMASMGVTRTVLRSGSKKALINPHEPLTAEARAQAEGMMDQIYGVFMGHVATSRKMDYAKADAAFGQGREFVGQQAVDAGLASSVTSFDNFISGLQQQVDKTQGDPHNAGNHQRGTSMIRKAFSEAQVTAMLASGMTEMQIEAADKSAFEASEKVAAEAKAAAEVKAQADAAAALLAAKTNTSTLTAGDLMDKVLGMQAEVIKANSERDTAKALVAPLQAQIEQCRGVVTASLNTMKIGLGGSATDMKASSVEDILKAHTDTETAFKAKFPTGQVSATSAATGELDKHNEPEWMRTAASVTASTASRAKA